MFKQCVLVALACFAFTPQAHRQVIEDMAFDDAFPNGGVIVAASRARKRIASMQAAAWQQNGQRYLRDAHAVPQLVAQPAEPWDLKKCIGRDGVVTKQAYQKTVGIEDSFELDRDPWRVTLGLKMPQDISDQRKIELLKAVAPFRRDECCGGQAMLFWQKENCNADEDCGQKARTKMKCIGAGEGEACRRRDMLGMLFGRSGCKEGYKCALPLSDNTSSELGDVDDVGVCVPSW